MAKRKSSGEKINKSDEIRRVYHALGKDASPKDIIDTLAAEGIQVKAGLVNNVLHRERRKSGPASGRRGRVPARTNGRATGNGKSAGNALDVIRTAKELIDQAGGSEAAKEVIEALG